MRKSLPLLLAALLLGCHAAPKTIPARQPNILLLIVDCLRADAVSANGYARPTTPNLDQIAKDGTRFTGAMTPVEVSLCGQA